jgi:hypothetical protein
MSLQLPDTLMENTFVQGRIRPSGVVMYSAFMFSVLPLMMVSQSTEICQVKDNIFYQDFIETCGCVGVTVNNFSDYVLGMDNIKLMYVFVSCNQNSVQNHRMMQKLLIKSGKAQNMQ